MRALVRTQIGEEEFLEVQDLSPRPCGPTQLRIAVAGDSANFPALVEGLGPAIFCVVAIRVVQEADGCALRVGSHVRWSKRLSVR